MGRARQTAIGLILAGMIIAAWLSVHVYGVFALRLSSRTAWAILPLILLQTWLGSGMFIVAHDAMHASLAPKSPALNRWVGRLALGLYAFFPFDRLAGKHHAHHRHAGMSGDPDFHLEAPRSFWPWYKKFFTEYFHVAQMFAIAAVVTIYAMVLHANVVNIMLFWAMPALASSLQLFMFGTWLPHRHNEASFSDRHNARTLNYGWLLSLATCFHFGYHLEHHRSPGAPWWALPRVRADGRRTLTPTE